MADEMIASFEFAEAFSGEWVYARVGVTEGKVGLTLSLETDGDVSAFLQTHDCERLVAALQRALQMAGVRGPQRTGDDDE